MAPTDFEKKLRERLDKREIQPSEGAWDRIEQQLAAPKSSAGSLRRRRIAYAAAASVLLLLGLGIYGLLRNPALPGPAVLSPGSVPDPEPAPADSPIFEPAPEEVTALPASEGKQLRETGSSFKEPEAAAELPVAVRSEPIEVPARDTTALTEQINSQLDAVLAEVSELEARQGGVSEAEIDSLLRKAQGQIALRAQLPPRDSVDAMALLMDTEEELDRSFREQLFDRLKTGFDRVRTAVAARND